MRAIISNEAISAVASTILYSSSPSLLNHDKTGPRAVLAVLRTDRRRPTMTYLPR